MEYEVILAGKPIPLRRPRFSRGRVYDSQHKLKEAVSFDISRQLPKGVITYLGPISMLFRFFMPIPKSLSKKKKLGLVGNYHYKKPDIDNLVKFYCDSANGVMFNDDSQISNLKAFKYYSDDPRTEITMYHMDMLSMSMLSMSKEEV